MSADLRDVLADRIERRHRSLFRKDRAHQLAALRAGERVIVDARQLASALSEAGLVDAAQHNAILDEQDFYVVEPDGRWH